MDIGKEIKTVEVTPAQQPQVQPLPEPVRRETPAELPDPVAPVETPEKVEV